MKNGQQNTNRFLPIAIIGISTLFSRSQNPREFWTNIINKQDLITDIPDSHWLIDDYYDPDLKQMDKTYCKRGTFLEDIDFNPMEFGIPPNVIPALDPSQLLTLIVAREAFRDATGEKYLTADLSKVSVILGTCALQATQNAAGRMQKPIWSKALRELGWSDSDIQRICDRVSDSYIPWQENSFPGMLSNVVAGRIANRFNLGGTNCVVDAACAGSLAAFSMAVSELQLGAAKMVLTGGFDTLNDIITFMSFTKTKALSFTGDCRPFSDQADGTLLGEGIGMFVLKRLDDAEKDGDSIYAVIRGIGSSSDGRSKSIYAPVAKGQSVAILRAYEQAGYSPATVELIEAHGTGTRAGDFAEFNGLTLAFQQAGDTRRQQCALGSVKSQIGHTKAAAGAAGLFKAVMALHHKMLPPTIKIEKPNSELAFDDSPFYLNTESRPWLRNANHPRRAGVSAFGFGGSNYHITLEEYVGPGKKPLKLRTFPTELIIFTANQPSELIEQCEQFLQAVNQASSIVQIAKTSQESFNARDQTRLAVVAYDWLSLRNKLQQALSFIKVHPERAIMLEQGIFYSAQATPGKIAMIFPSHESVYLGMSEDITMGFDSVRKEWDGAMNNRIGEIPLTELIFPPPTFDANQKKLHETRIKSPGCAEITTAKCSLIYYHFLQSLQLQPDVLIGHGCGELTALCAANALNENDLFTLLKEWNALPDKQARTHFLKPLKLNPTEKPVLANKTGEPFPRKSDKIKAILIDKEDDVLEKIKYYSQQGITTFIEVGPQNILTKNIRRLLPENSYQTVHIDRKNQHGLTVLWHALGKLMVLGMNPDFSPLWQEYRDLEDTSAAANDPSAYKIKINGTLYGRPYPPNSNKTKQEKDAARPIQNLPNLKEHAMSNNNNPYFIQMQQELQKQVIDSHNNFQRTMAESHNAFLQVINNLASSAQSTVSAAALQNVNLPNHAEMAPLPNVNSLNPAPIPYFTQGQAPAPVQNREVARPIVTQPIQSHRPVVIPATPSHSQLTPPSSQFTSPHSTPTSPHFPPANTASVVNTLTPSASTHSATVSPEPIRGNLPTSSNAKMAGNTTTPVAAVNDLETILLDVVVDKTGYPAGMLKMDMAIEADLGIDSIKRVEILSALSERIPHLPDLDTNELGQLQTLGDIVQYMKDKIPAKMPA